MELLKFEADWCGPCKQQDELLEDFDTVPVTHLDIEEHTDTANDYGVRSLPTMVLIDEDGLPIKIFTGVTHPEEIENEIR